MALIPVVIDYETFWSTTHSLTKMNPIDYVMHPETEIISVAVKVGKYPSDVVFGEDKVKAALNKIDWSDKIAIGHNMAGFDAMILAWRCGIHPKMWACTQAMARPHFAKTVGLSLAKLVDHYELGKKDQTALFLTRGKHLKDFTPDELKAMAIYNKADTDQCYALFQRLGKLTSAKEMVQIDHTIRMLVNPAFTVDPGLLRAALMEEQERKRVVLTELAGMLYSAEQLVEARLERDVPAEELVREAMASPAKFSEILTARNVPVPMKPSPTDPSREIPALAKTDQAFLDLQEHDDPVVAAAAAARLDVKSTLLESRIQSFLSASVAAAGRLPIPLVYYGAHTGRWCLVADTVVLVYDSITRTQQQKRIVDVLPEDLVWDGVAFVSHGGVAFSGFSEVITHDGITGTKDHVVFTEDGEIGLLEARTRGVPIKTGAGPTDDDVDAAGIYFRHHKKFNSL